MRYLNVYKKILIVNYRNYLEESIEKETLLELKKGNGSTCLFPFNLSNGWIMSIKCFIINSTLEVLVLRFHWNFETTK